MKRTSSMIYTPSVEATDLFLTIVNNGVMYPRIRGIIDNLRRKYRKGVYDHKKAVDIWYYVATEGAERYAREYASEGYKFTVTERYTVAVDLEARYFEDVEEVIE